jgi:hypothetical protein
MSTYELKLTCRVSKISTYLIRARRGNHIHEDRSGRAACLSVRIRAYCLPTPCEGRDKSLVCLNLANTSTGFELPDAYRVIIGCGEKVLAIWVEHEGADPVVVTDL